MPFLNYDPARVILCSQSAACAFWHPIVFSAIVLFLVITGFAYTTLLERRFIAFFQQRVGPNRVGPLGILQPAADGLKLIFKEDIIPAQAFKFVYYLAPILKTVPTLILIAVIPWGPNVNIPWFNGEWYRVPLGIADVNVGVLWILAITSIGTYGVVLAGWASNNKYAMLGGLRASAQMISYELSLGLVLAVPVMIVGSMSVGDIIAAQQGLPILGWFVFQNPLAAGIAMVALLAEVSRAPFDLPEAEQELTQGYMTEYSGMKFAMFMMAEYLGMIGVSMVAIALFFGGWGVGLGLVEGAPLLGPAIFIGKVVLFLIGMVWIRATLPRFRYDRLMSFGWKVMLPLSLLAVAWTAIAVVIGDTADSPAVYGVVSVVVFLLVVGGGYWFLSRQAAEEQPARPLADDPVVTGERRGAAALALDALGTLIAIPYALFEKLGPPITNARRGTATWLEGVSRRYGGEDTPPAAPPSAGAEPSGD